ncbi:MAG: glycosyl transferase [Bacteroidales bacterium]|nr:glycosyl transferase [Bacteroidales bacterium]
MGKNLDLRNPQTYNAKLQWLKLNYRAPDQTRYVDKYEVRSDIANIIGSEYLVPLVGMYNKVEDIDWSALPDKFVLKCTHGCGTNIICTDKKQLPIEKTVKSLNSWMKKNWFWYGREWPYKNVIPRIICEEYLADNIVDYKFMCFHGEPKLIQIHTNRGQDDQTLDFYDINWNRTPIRRFKNTCTDELPQPKKLSEMIEIARELSSGEIHVRVDLYEVRGKIYFGEKTYYSASGFSPFAEDEHDELLGSWIKLSI